MSIHVEAKAKNRVLFKVNVVSTGLFESEDKKNETPSLASGRPKMASSERHKPITKIKTCVIEIST